MHINEASNLLLRHYSDTLVISIFYKREAPEGSIRPPSEVTLFRTKLELNNIELNEEKMTVMVVGTSSMSAK